MSEDNKYYVYALLDPGNGYAPYYIGKGCSNRVKQHFMRVSLLEKNHKNTKIKSNRLKGYEDCYSIIIENISNDEACFQEIYFISYFGKDTLTNHSDGGDEPPTFYGKDSNFYGILPWENFKATNETKFIWAMADEIKYIFDNNINIKAQSVRRLLEEQLNISISNKGSLSNMILKFKKGWNPYEDLDWITFKEKSTLDKSIFKPYVPYKKQGFNVIGTRPWDSPASTTKSKNIWSQATLIYEYYLCNKELGYKTFTKQINKELNSEFSPHVVRAVLNRFKKNWIPNSDTSWINFKDRIVENVKD